MTPPSAASISLATPSSGCRRRTERRALPCATWPGASCGKTNLHGGPFAMVNYCQPMAESWENPRPEQKTARSDSYARAGVDIDAGNEAVARYAQRARAMAPPRPTRRHRRLRRLFRAPRRRSRALVASTDGVGTKILIAAELGRYDGVGARPGQPLRQRHPGLQRDAALLPRLPRGRQARSGGGGRDRERVHRKRAARTIARCSAARPPRCRGSISRRTSISPERSSGIVEIEAVAEARVASSRATRSSGLPAVGLHTNGYSLARALIASRRMERSVRRQNVCRRAARRTSVVLSVPCARSSASRTSRRWRTSPAAVCSKTFRARCRRTCKAVFEQQRWSVPPILAELVRRGDLGARNGIACFNMGVGFTLVVPVTDAAAAIAAVPGAKVVGWIESRIGEEPRVVVHP